MAVPADGDQQTLEFLKPSVNSRQAEFKPWASQPLEKHLGPSTLEADSCQNTLVKGHSLQVRCLSIQLHWEWILEESPQQLTAMTPLRESASHLAVLRPGKQLKPVVSSSSNQPSIPILLGNIIQRPAGKVGSAGGRTGWQVRWGLGNPVHCLHKDKFLHPNLLKAEPVRTS